MVDPFQLLRWENHEHMMQNVMEMKRNWSRWEMDEEFGYWIKLADKRATMTIGGKINVLARVCQERVADLMD